MGKLSSGGGRLLSSQLDVFVVLCLVQEKKATTEGEGRDFIPFVGPTMRSVGALNMSRTIMPPPGFDCGRG